MVSPPVIDFGRILLTNLPNHNDVFELRKFCRYMLDIYAQRLNMIYKQAKTNEVQYDIIDNLLLSYINLDEKEREAIKNHIPILCTLFMLGSIE
ncbi:hypothetical protein X777_04797 [Ooceraea biroi]|uniref:Uncharacterized protein n=1 Tax=Ooceraea biroi TaxID=2015173 RepID=A0A026WHA2_OOCBI|nr:hypothetical protein X777_04797 [Ooceraea biroi]